MSPIGSPFRAMSGSIIDLSTVIDDFEDGDVAEYEQSSTGTFSATTGTVAVGSYAGASYADNGTTFTITAETSLPRYPSRGDTFNYWIRLDRGSGGPQFTFGWAWDGADAYYGVILSSDSYLSNDFNISKNSSANGRQILTGSTPAVSNNTWYQVEVDFQDTISATLKDASGNPIDTISVTDSDSYYDDGGIRFAHEVIGDGDSYAWIDHMEILP